MDAPLCDLLIDNCSVLLPTMDVVAGCAIAIQGQTIHAIGKSAEIRSGYTPRVRMDATGKLAIPGLIDAHTHLAHQLLRSRIVGERPPVWQRILVPFESTLTDDDVYHSARLACLQMARAGITTFGEVGLVDVEGIIRAADESGMRASIARRSSDLHNDTIPKEYTDQPGIVVQKTEALFRAHDGAAQGRIRIAFSITSLPNSSASLVEAAACAAGQHGAILHVHIGEHVSEIDYCLRSFGLRPVEFLDRFGALGPNLLAAHAVRLSDREIVMMAEKGAKPVHCPWANLGNHGFPKTPTMLSLGMKVGLGTDGAKRVDLDLFAQMRLLEAAMSAYFGLPSGDASIVSGQDMFRMPTMGSSAALGLDHEVGSLEAGKKADIVLLRWREPHFYPAHLQFPMLVDVANARDVSDVIIDGRLVVKDRVHQLLDAEEVMAKAAERLSSILARQ